ncbi:nectin-4 [Boleophthalmus pectinirostris]|uniref:nectin-4 n=1 Tax=Boleophthalmus pectinirostris TaxID=150288 RepID=UPI000A1C73F0|nr:nectin-4 [Boleophthalmus pectinirostris]
MDLCTKKTCPLLLLLLYVSLARGAFVEPSQPRSSHRSLSDSQTRLPCRYQAGPDEKVVQVTWYKELPDRTKDQMITAHFTDGHTEFGRYAGRVRFESSSPTENSALLIPSTEVSDEGVYTCHISTFPNGNFERTIALTVWSLPISSLEPVVMREGQSFGVAASCRSMGRPAPRLSWDTPLAGQVQNRSSESGAVTSLFSLHPLRSMNGKQLDCLVWHPGFDQPKRISNTLEVQYPPEVKIVAGSGDWFVGMEKAELQCEAQGQPPVSNVTWKWKGGALPQEALVIGTKLVFKRALRLNDSGVYECVALNAAGPGRTEYEFTVAERSFRMADLGSDNFLLIMIGAGAALLVLVMVVVIVLVNRHHKNKHKKLELELSEKTEEINSLSRQTSLRRLNSVSTDPRVQPEDYALLRVDSRMKNSQMSLERPIYKGSQGTLTGKWGPPGGVEVDELGRPVVWSETEMESEREERRRRVESYLKSSNMSLDSGLPSSLVPLKPQPEEVLVPCRHEELPHLRHAPSPNLRHAPSPNIESWSPSAPGQVDDDTDSGTYQISEALNNHFYFSNGQLRPRPHSNAILLNPSRPSSVIRTQKT